MPRRPSLCRYCGVVLLGLVGPGCTGDDVCIAEPQGPAIVDAVVDALTGQSVVEGAQGFVRLGTVRTELLPHSFDSAGRLRSLGAQVAAPGSYQLVITQANYALFDTTGIRVVEGRCFLNGPAVTVVLRPLAPAKVLPNIAVARARR